MRINLENTLLIEPSYPRKWTSIALMRLSYYLKRLNKEVWYVRGAPKRRETYDIEPEQIISTSLWTWYADRVIEEVNKWSKVFPDVPTYIGGVAATALTEYMQKRIPQGEIIKGTLPPEVLQCPPDYSLADMPDLRGNIEPPKIKNKRTGNWARNWCFVQTTYSCPFNCPYCFVKEIEGHRYIKSDTWQEELEAKPDREVNIIDSNFTSQTSDRIREIAEVIGDREVVIEQGVDIKTLNEDKVEALSEMKLNRVRLAFDDSRYEEQVKNSMAWIRKHITKSKSKIIVFVLCNHNDSLEDAMSRVQKIMKWGGTAMAMRYQPFGRYDEEKGYMVPIKKNSYVDPNWDKPPYWLDKPSQPFLLYKFVRWCNAKHHCLQLGSLKHDTFSFEKYDPHNEPSNHGKRQRKLYIL